MYKNFSIEIEPSINNLAIDICSIYFLLDMKGAA
jgi:hypothetical protein